MPLTLAVGVTRVTRVTRLRPMERPRNRAPSPHTGKLLARLGDRTNAPITATLEDEVQNGGLGMHSRGDI